MKPLEDAQSNNSLYNLVKGLDVVPIRGSIVPQVHVEKALTGILYEGVTLFGIFRGFDY